jgi:hypothetical protein
VVLELRLLPISEGGVKMAYETTPLGCKKVILWGSLMDLCVKSKLNSLISDAESDPAVLKHTVFVILLDLTSPVSITKPIGLDWPGAISMRLFDTLSKLFRLVCDRVRVEPYLKGYGMGCYLNQVAVIHVNPSFSFVANSYTRKSARKLPINQVR